MQLSGLCESEHRLVVNLPRSVSKVSQLFSQNPLKSLPEETRNGGLAMRVLVACAIIITATIGLGGCFHHDQQMTATPLK
jgi:hypothetical protein